MIIKKNTKIRIAINQTATKNKQAVAARNSIWTTLYK